MKKYIFPLITIFMLIISIAPVHAQNYSCDAITDDATYNDCCAGPVIQGDINKCSQYKIKTCQNIDSDAKYSMCGCTGDTSTDSNQCIGYAASKNPAVTGQLGSELSTTAVNTGAPVTTSAAPSSTDQALATCSAIQFKTLLDIAIWAKCIIGGIVIPGIFMLAFVVFLWGVFKFIRSSEQKDKQESKQFIYMGLIGLFVMTSVWGIIKIFGTTLGIDSTVPTLQTTALDINKASKK